MSLRRSIDRPSKQNARMNRTPSVPCRFIMTIRCTVLPTIVIYAATAQSMYNATQMVPYSLWSSAAYCSVDQISNWDCQACDLTPKPISITVVSRTRPLYRYIMRGIIAIRWPVLAHGPLQLVTQILSIPAAPKRNSGRLWLCCQAARRFHRSCVSRVSVVYHVISSATLSNSCAGILL